MTWSLPNRLGTQYLLVPTQEATHLLGSGDWAPVPAHRVLDLLDEVPDPALARVLGELGPGPSPFDDVRVQRERLVDALRPAPAGRGTLCMLARERVALDVSAGRAVCGRRHVA